MSIFISCGETSGDNYLALLITSLKKKGFTGDLWGMIGPRTEKAGGRKVWSCQELQLMGFIEVLPSVPRLMKLKNRIMDEILSVNPEQVIVVDSPDFHLPLIRSLRRNGFRGFIVYIAPPTVWAWREGRAKTLAECCNLCLPILPFENDFLLDKGVESRWIGHPLLDNLMGYKPPKNMSKYIGQQTVVALLPGSRPGEVKNHLPILLECAARLHTLAAKPVFSISTGLPEALKCEMRDKMGDWDFYEGPAKDIISVAEAVVGVSGTVSVESMLLGKYMIVIYEGSFFSWLIYKLMIKIRYISIPNIMAGKIIFPEYLRRDISVDNILGSLERYLKDDAYHREIAEEICVLQGKMGRKGASDFWADCILELRKP